MSPIYEGSIVFDADGAFYNPKMRLNRDICVAMIQALGISEYIDALSASGIRGLRAAKEAVVQKVTLNDISASAYQCIIRNIARNNLTNCKARCCNANALLHERHFEAVDIDPFGSPSPFISSASRSATSFLFLTATDTAPLCGAHLKSGIRKYMALPVKTDYHREMGARILLGLAARELARLDKSADPLLTHATEHYVRIYLRIEAGAKKADRSLENIGYIQHCFECGNFKGVQEPKKDACNACEGKTVLAGPLWLGKIQKREIIKRARTSMGKDHIDSMRLLEVCSNEIDHPMYYNYHKLCSRLGIAPIKLDNLVDYLRGQGWEASRTHFSGVGIKTDCSAQDLERILRHP